VVQVDDPGENRAYLQGVNFDPNEFRIVPMRHDSLMLTDMLDIQESALLANFSYFFTNNLRMMYNMSVDAEESLDMVDFPFDYIGEWREGEFRETVPLYRKGYVGSWDDGRLFIGYLTMREVSCEIQGTIIHIPLHAINPGLQKDFTIDNDLSATDQPICLFTPAYPKRRVGQGRYNLAIINEIIVHIGINKAVTVPPVGVVLSLHPEHAKRYLSQVNKGERLWWKISFEELPQKSRLRWLYGGYNMLVLHGENLVKTEKQAEQTLRKEGWYLPQSMCTQETQLLPDVRHPRIVIGTTDQGRILLLAISGRTKISCGATFTEIALYCQHLLSGSDRLRNLVNLDGGASVFLEVRDAGRRVVLNFPAPTDLNPAGVVRPNSAFLKIVRNKPS
jgi:hypothetical protein